MMRGSGEADQRRGKNNATKIAKGMAGVCLLGASWHVSRIKDRH
jgi:hypothetical protein